MTDFMLIYKGSDPQAMERATPEQIQEVMGRWGAWFKELEASGNLRNPGAPLGPGGKTVSSKGVATDQVIPEVKELVGGFSIIAADSLEQAVELAKGSPHLAAGPDASVDVRPVIEM